MNVIRYAAIIAEYNPMHTGHVFHLSQTKNALNTDITAIIQSGAFTQRGSYAILDKYIRAKHAVQGGADIVIELPTIFALSNAEFFAKGAIRLLSSIRGEKYLSFGSECGKIQPLNDLADIMINEPQQISENIKTNLKKHPYPYARAKAYKEYAEKFNIQIPDIEAPNNMLAIEYIKAISALDNTIIPYTIKREGASYKCLSCEERYISSTGVRAALKNNNLANIKDKLPPYVYEDLTKIKTVDNTAIILYKLQNMTAAEIKQLYDVTEGLENRIKKTADKACSFAQFWKEIQTKRYTSSRLKRILSYALLDITKQLHEFARTAPPYFNVLAINAKYVDFLSKLSNYGKIYTNNNQLALSDNPLSQLDAKAFKLHKILTEQDSPNSMIIVDNNNTSI